MTDDLQHGAPRIVMLGLSERAAVLVRDALEVVNPEGEIEQRMKPELILEIDKQLEVG